MPRPTRLVPLIALLALTLSAPAAGQLCYGELCPGPRSAIGTDLSVLLALDGDAVELHVAPQLDMPPGDFVWVTPAPPGVRVGISDRGIIGNAPYHIGLRPRCPDCIERDWPDSPYPEPTPPEGPVSPPVEVPMGGVEVLERRALASYDLAVLAPDTGEALTDWLIANGFPVPADAAPGFAPYLPGSVFVAARLSQPDPADEIAALGLRYPADAAALPLRAWSAVAPPDTGIEVRILGPARAAPLDALHIHPNLAYVDWRRCGWNYRDVVAAAFAEAGEAAWVTDRDYPAGRVWDDLRTAYDLDAVAASETLADVLDALRPFHSAFRSMLRGIITPPEGVDVETLLGCLGCFEAQIIPIDGPILAERVATLLGARRTLNGLVARSARITRLFTLIGPGWPVADPVFGYNPDLPGVALARDAEAHYTCDGRFTVERDGVVLYRSAEDGSNPHGLVWGEPTPTDMPAAARIERLTAGGAPEVVVDNTAVIAAFLAERPEPEAPDAGPTPVDTGPTPEDVGPIPGDAGPIDAPFEGDGMGRGGCACDVGQGPAPVGPLLVLLVVGLVRRPRSGSGRTPHPTPRPGLLAASLAVLALLAPAPAGARTCSQEACPGPPSALNTDLAVMLALDGDALEVHVQPELDLPPGDFVWVTPAAPGVRVELSDRRIFHFDPGVAFRLVPRCPDCLEWIRHDSPFTEPEPPDGPLSPPVAIPVDGVEVIERRPLGPYDVAIVDADDGEALTTWLLENGYRVPLGAAPGLAPYATTSVFVAARLMRPERPDLLPPLGLRYAADAVTLPLRAWSAVAPPDTGVTVRVVGPARAVPLDALHVEPNPALVDWARCAWNYRDVLAAAFVEAGGPAWATDWARDTRFTWSTLKTDFDVEALAASRDLSDVLRVLRHLHDAAFRPILRDVITPPARVDVDVVIECPDCFEPQIIPVDGPTLAARLEAEVLALRRRLTRIAARSAGVTLFYTLIGPGWPVVDPVFVPRPDLPAVDLAREAEAVYTCDGRFVVEMDGARLYAAAADGSNPYARVWGEAGGPGADQPAAVRIGRFGEAGPLEVVADHSDVIPGFSSAPAGAGADAGPGDAPLDGHGEGCACDAGHSPPSATALMLVGLLALRRPGVSRRRGTPIRPRSGRRRPCSR